MPKGVLVVETSPVTTEREDEFNDWYNDTHLVEILKLSGFTSARRFRKLADGGHRYLAIYEVEADDMHSAIAGLGEAAKRREMTMSDALGSDPAPSMTLFEQISERFG